MKTSIIKTITTSAAALSLLATSAFAGAPVVQSSKAVMPMAPESFYNAHEISGSVAALLGVAGGELSTSKSWSDQTAWGVDVEGKYFVNRNFGIGIEGQYLAINNPYWGAALNLYLRAPLSEGSQWAPYIFGGLGGIFASDNGEFEGHIGGGLEYRFTPKIGTFADFRHVWLNGSDDVIDQFQLIRVGFNFVF